MNTSSEPTTLLEAELEGINAELDELTGSIPLRGDQLSRLEEVEQRFTKAILPFERVETELKKLDAKSSANFISYLPTFDRTNKKLVMWGCVATAFSLADLKLVTVQSGTQNVSFFGFSLQGLSAEEINFGFLAMVLYYNIKLFWLSCEQNAVMATYLKEFQTELKKITSIRRSIREKLVTLGLNDLQPATAELTLAHAMENLFRAKLNLRHLYKALIQMGVPAVAALVATITSIAFLDFQMTFSIPILNTPNKIALSFVVILFGLNFWLSKLANFNPDASIFADMLHDT